jgi:hypothetical protein
MYIMQSPREFMASASLAAAASALGTDPEYTLRFYALRLHEARMITSTPNRIIAEGTDWRFLNEIKRELKA